MAQSRRRERDGDDDNYDNGTIIYHAMYKQQQLVKTVESNGRNTYSSGFVGLYGE